MFKYRNVWGPNLQTDIVKIIANRYKLSRRFHAILESAPGDVEEKTAPVPAHIERVKVMAFPKDDPEHAMNGVAEKILPLMAEGPEDANHYEIASRLINYQSLDLGEKCKSQQSKPQRVNV